MRIVNVVVNVDNCVKEITSFGIWEEQLSKDVVSQAEMFFIKTIEEFVGEELLEHDKDHYLDNGYYEDSTYGYYTVCLCWSDI